MVNSASQKENGFSLIELMIAVGIFSIITLGISSLISMSLKSQHGMDVTTQLENNIFEVKMMLSNRTTCTSNLANLDSRTFDSGQAPSETYPGSSFSQILVTGSQLPIFTNNKPLGYHPAVGTTPEGSYAPGTNLTIALANIKPVQPNALYLANLNFYLNKDVSNGNAVSGPINIVRRLPIMLETTAAGTTQTITACYTFNSSVSSSDLQAVINSSESATCASLGGTFSNGACALPPPTNRPGTGGILSVGTMGVVDGLVDPGPSVPTCPLMPGSPCATDGSICRLSINNRYVTGRCGSFQNPETGGGGFDGQAGDAGGAGDSSGGGE